VSESDARVVLVNVPDAETALRIGRVLVEERLAAAVNIASGLRSLYWWEGAVRDRSEVLLVVKTSAVRVEALAVRIEALHPYELPGVVALPVVGGSAPYLDWITTETSQ
jgi:periplasmic divalent cation tolerance protein